MYEIKLMEFPLPGTLQESPADGTGVGHSAVTVLTSLLVVVIVVVVEVRDVWVLVMEKVVVATWVLRYVVGPRICEQ
jgi:hypothetical protein